MLIPLAASRPGLPVDYVLDLPHVIAGSLKTLPSSVTCSPAVPDAAATTSLLPVRMETKTCEAVIPAGTRSCVLIGPWCVQPSGLGTVGSVTELVLQRDWETRKGFWRLWVWGSGRRSSKFIKELTGLE